ncbi:MAG: hypothetical protein AVDCRST_MAG56-4013, partial [uncultured Cytophagales bacterium]
GNLCLYGSRRTHRADRGGAARRGAAPDQLHLRRRRAGPVPVLLLLRPLHRRRPALPHGRTLPRPGAGAGRPEALPEGLQDRLPRLPVVQPGPLPGVCPPERIPRHGYQRLPGRHRRGAVRAHAGQAPGRRRGHEQRGAGRRPLLPGPPAIHGGRSPLPGAARGRDGRNGRNRCRRRPFLAVSHHGQPRVPGRLARFGHGAGVPGGPGRTRHCPRAVPRDHPPGRRVRAQAPARPAQRPLPDPAGRQARTHPVLAVLRRPGRGLRPVPGRRGVARPRAGPTGGGRARRLRRAHPRRPAYRRRRPVLRRRGGGRHVRQVVPARGRPGLPRRRRLLVRADHCLRPARAGGRRPLRGVPQRAAAGFAHVAYFLRLGHDRHGHFADEVRAAQPAAPRWTAADRV